jgi:hypothetical protein
MEEAFLLHPSVRAWPPAAYLDGQELGLETALLLRSHGLPVARQRERVLGVPPHLVVLRHVLRGNPHRDVRVGLRRHERRVHPELVADHRHPGHRLHSAREHHVCRSDRHGLRR